MTYQSTVSDLASVPNADALVDSVTTLVDDLITEQGNEATTEIHRFMLYFNGPMPTRITGMMKHLAARQPRPIDPVKLPPLVETGLMAGWRSVDNSVNQTNHLLIGLPFMYTILITTVTDKINSTKRIHSVVGTFTKTDHRAMGTNPVNKETETVSSIKEVKRILGYLKTLGDEEPIIPIVKDPKKTISYANEQYVARWINSDGSLPRVSTPTP